MGVFPRGNLLKERVASGRLGYGYGAKKRKGRPKESLQAFEGSAEGVSQIIYCFYCLY